MFEIDIAKGSGLHHSLELEVVFKNHTFIIILTGGDFGASPLAAKADRSRCPTSSERKRCLPAGRYTAFITLHRLLKLLSAAKRGGSTSPGKLFGRDNM